MRGEPKGVRPLPAEFVEAERRKLVGLSHRSIVSLYAAMPGSPANAATTLLSTAVLIDILIWRAGSQRFDTKSSVDE